MAIEEDPGAGAAGAAVPVVTLGLPLAERDGLGARLKSVAQRREELRARHHAALNAKRGALRIEPTSYMKNTLDRFKLTSLLESENSKDKLAQAGYRGPFGIDAFVYGTGYDRQLYPLCEINARHTFGHVARALGRRLGITRLGFDPGMPAGGQPLLVRKTRPMA